MLSGLRFPLTLTLSPREREPHSTAWEYSLKGRHFPALPIVLPLPEGAGWGEGEERFLLSTTASGCSRTEPRCSASKDKRPTSASHCCSLKAALLTKAPRA